MEKEKVITRTIIIAYRYKVFSPDGIISNVIMTKTNKPFTKKEIKELLKDYVEGSFLSMSEPVVEIREMPLSTFIRESTVLTSTLLVKGESENE